MVKEKEPIKTRCPECNKVMFGFTEKQINWMLDQHKLVHKYNIEKIREKGGTSK